MSIFDELTTNWQGIPHTYRVVKNVRENNIFVVRFQTNKFYLTIIGKLLI